MLAKKFPIEKYHLIYSSDLSRAYETAKELIAGRPIEIYTDCRLRERLFGSIQGQSLSKLQQLAKKNGVSIVEYTPPDGERPIDVLNRVIDFIQSRLIPEVINHESKETETLIVSHGGVIREMIKYFKSFGHHSFSSDNRSEFIPPNTSVSEFVVQYDPQLSIIKSVESVRIHDITHMGERLQEKALSQKQINKKDGPSI